MTKRSPEQVYAVLIQAGFSPAAATTMTAIAGAESGYNDQSVGDVSLENTTWGPSLGLFQIRTQKAATGTGGNRDATWLAASDLNQAKAAYAISSGGTNFGPWTTYTSGKYQQFLNAAKTAAGAVGTNAGKFIDSIGSFLDPLGIGKSAASSANGAINSALDAAVTPLLEGGKKLGLTAGFAAMGGILLVGGLIVLVYPGVKRRTEQTVRVAANVAKVAAK